MTPDRDPIDDLAERLLDADTIDWAAEETSAPDDHARAIVRHLRVLRAVADTHGTAGSRPAATSEDPAAFPARWGHLRILERVGHGSFGDVFRAWDETLDREVALKLLRAGEDDSGGSSVVEEGRLLARVRHPHVVSIYGAERRDERVGLWMEFVRGRTLAQIVAADGPFSAAEAALIGGDICGAVAAVHAAGLLHRDIKAQNVVRETGGRVVLMDFGAGVDRVGPAAGVTGTPVYLAPEVLAGDPPSAASDVYSVGVLLFFLVTGRYPVSGRTFEEVSAAHAAGRRSLRDARPDLPQWFTAAVDRATDPDTARRFPTPGALQAALAGAAGTRPRGLTRIGRYAAVAAVVAAAALAGVILKDWGSAPVAAYSSVAVLPLQNVSGDPANDYLAEGITEDLIRTLSRSRSLKVISLTSSRYYAAHPRPMPVIARELGVEAVVEGALNVAGDRITVTTRIVEARADRNLSEQRAQRPLREVARLREDIASAIGSGLRQAPPSMSSTRVDAAAYRAYLQGRYQLAKRTRESILRARDHFQRAIDTEPLFVEAHAGLAQAFVLAGAFHALPQAEAFAAAEAAAQRTLAMEEHSMAYAVLGYVTAARPATARDAFGVFEKALAIDAGNTTARQWYALTLMGHGRAAEAVTQIEAARSLDPLSMVIASDAGLIYSRTGDHEKAAEVLSNIVAMYPEFGEGHRQLGTVLLHLQRYPEAERELERALELQGRMLEALGDLGYVKVRLGKRAEAEAILEELRAAPQSSPERLFPQLLLEAALGHREETMRALRACQDRYGASCDLVLRRLR